MKYGYKHVQVASALKRAVKCLFSFQDEELEGDAKDAIHSKWKVSPRKIMDFVGTRVFQHELQEIIPHVGRTFWIQDLLEREKTNEIVISDVRFLHEQEILRKRPCVIIRVTRENTSEDGLESEKESKMLDVDYTIKNDGSIKELYSQCDDIMRAIIKRN